MELRENPETMELQAECIDEWHKRKNKPDRNDRFCILCESQVTLDLEFGRSRLLQNQNVRQEQRNSAKLLLRIRHITIKIEDLPRQTADSDLVKQKYLIS
jgi:hypothetical protein